ncbi:MAG: acetyl-CoA carboxylase carboxyl transferase subunit alpha, partial [Candidatus Aminicenantes bacterium]|nr:acetyl-CoA carboxylase carboxyl transferase subunit alpha [Candidatus Aminicenantes bacterium]
MKKEEDFYQLEKNIVLLKKQIADLEDSEEPGKKEKILGLRAQIEKEWARIAPRLTATHIVQIARHPQRPYTLDYLTSLVEDFTEMHGD